MKTWKRDKPLREVLGKAHFAGFFVPVDSFVGMNAFEDGDEELVQQLLAEGFVRSLSGPRTAHPVFRV